MNIHGKDIKIFAGNSNEKLATSIAECLGLPLGKAEIGMFSDGEISVSIGESVRWQRRLCGPEHFQPGQPAPDGAAFDDRRVPPCLGGADYRGDALLRLCASGPQEQGA